MGVRVTYQHTKNHESGYKGVARKLFAGAGGVPRTYSTTSDMLQEKTKIFWESKGYTPHAIAVHPGVSKAAKDKLKRIFARLASFPELRKVFKDKLYLEDGFEEANSSDWDDVRELRERDKARDLFNVN